MPESIDLDKVKATLGKLIDVLRDSHEGFTEIGKHVKDDGARRFFLEETQARANFAGELENELHRLGVKDVHQHGMIFWQAPPLLGRDQGQPGRGRSRASGYLGAGRRCGQEGICHSLV